MDGVVLFVVLRLIKRHKVSSSPYPCFPEKKHNFRKYNVSQVDSLGIPYDYLSVMHYSETAFGNGATTIIARDPSVIQLGQRVGLSPKDITQADLLYRCNGRSCEDLRQIAKL